MWQKRQREADREMGAIWRIEKKGNAIMQMMKASMAGLCVFVCSEGTIKAHLLLM